MSIDGSLMDEVLGNVGMFYSWEEIMERYNTLRVQSFAAIEQMDLDAIHRFNQSLKVRGDVMEECKIELARYINKYPRSNIRRNVREDEAYTDQIQQRNR